MELATNTQDLHELFIHEASYTSWNQWEGQEAINYATDVIIDQWSPITNDFGIFVYLAGADQMDPSQVQSFNDAAAAYEAAKALGGTVWVIAPDSPDYRIVVGVK